MNATTGTFQVKAWDQTPYDESGGLVLNRVRATMAYRGSIEGEGVLELLMCSPEGSPVTTFAGLERVTGIIGGRSGSAVFRHVGTYSAGVARSQWTIAQDSGTGGLKGVQGEGSYGDTDDGIGHGDAAPFKFSFQFKE